MPFITPDKIADTIISYLDDENTIFVFPTDIAASTWADWIVTHKEISGTDAVALERFTAWDKFKSENLSATQKGKKSIPSVLRKIFVRDLISQNADASKNGNPIFQRLINPLYAENAYAFTDWLSGILPSLKRWHDKFQAAGIDADSEDADYMMLYDKYLEYLEKHSLFEPAWLEPNFSGDIKENFFIFFPELLEDYDEYIEFFAKSKNIKIFSLPDLKENESRPAINFFTNARTELRALALQIKKLVADGVAWKDIAVSVPDISVWRPYIEREFFIYGIPYIMRSGEPLTHNSAGRFFSELQACVSENFSYDSVRALLLDDYVPWKNKRRNENFVRLGNECACVLGMYATEGETEIDVWKAAIRLSGEDKTTKAENEIFLGDFYKKLREDVTAITSAKTFADVRKSWFAFKEEFLDSENFSENANDILGRCLSELSVLIDIENEFVMSENKSVYKPFDFFVSEIENKIYQPQKKTDGVSVFPYKLSAMAPFEYQFVVDSSQKSLSVGYKSLKFLSPKKREQLRIEDNDKASDCFVRLYAGLSRCVFSGAAETFSGAAIQYSFLLQENKQERSERLQKIFEDVSKHDNIFAEKSFYTERYKSDRKTDENAKASIMKFQKDGFDLWKKKCMGSEETVDERIVPTVVKYCIDKKMKDYNSKYDRNKSVVHISQSDMNNFFPCPRKWLFANILWLKEDSLDAELMGKFDNGNIMHKILEKFLKSLQSEDKRLPRINDDGKLENEAEISKKLLDCTKETFDDKELDFHKKPIVLAILDSQKNNFVKVIINFLREFCAENVFGGWKVRFVEEKFHGKQNIVEDAKNQKAGENETEAGKNWTFIGKIDCILAEDNDDQKVAIVDFKTGTLPTAKQNIADEKGDLEDFQIPVYATMWSVYDKKKSDRNDSYSMPTRAVFWKIDDNKKNFVLKEKKGARENCVTASEYNHTIEAVHKLACDFYLAIEGGELSPVKEKVKTYSDCHKCKFNAICRTTYSVSQSVIS